jgi:hypothetical protein
MVARCSNGDLHDVNDGSICVGGHFCAAAFCLLIVCAIWFQLVTTDNRKSVWDSTLETFGESKSWGGCGLREESNAFTTTFGLSMGLYLGSTVLAVISAALACCQLTCCKCCGMRPSEASLMAHELQVARERVRDDEKSKRESARLQEQWKRRDR